jgi:hypothetical protein
MVKMRGCPCPGMNNFGGYLKKYGFSDGFFNWAFLKTSFPAEERDPFAYK